MNPRIEILKEKKLIGKKLTMSFSDYKAAELWKNFMPRRKEITNNLNNDLISVSVYRPKFYEEFNIENRFEKWATVEVSDLGNVPGDMGTLILTGGLYAVFDFRGSSNDTSIFKYILSTWLPESDYLLDDRPHFEILGAKFKTNDPDSEEEIWVPIKPKESQSRTGQIIV